MLKFFLSNLIIIALVGCKPVKNSGGKKSLSTLTALTVEKDNWCVYLDFKNLNDLAFVWGTPNQDTKNCTPETAEQSISSGRTLRFVMSPQPSTTPRGISDKEYIGYILSDDIEIGGVTTSYELHLCNHNFDSVCDLSISKTGASLTLKESQKLLRNAPAGEPLPQQNSQPLTQVFPNQSLKSIEADFSNETTKLAASCLSESNIYTMAIAYSELEGLKNQTYAHSSEIQEPIHAALTRLEAAIESISRTIDDNAPHDALVKTCLKETKAVTEAASHLESVLRGTQGLDSTYIGATRRISVISKEVPGKQESQ